MKYTKDQLKFAQSYYAYHNCKITRDLEDYTEYKSVCELIKDEHEFKSWEQVNQFLKPASDYKSLADKYK